MCVRAEKNSELTFKMKLLEKIVKIFENTNYFCNKFILERAYTWSFIPRWNSSQDEIIPVYGEMSLTVYTFLPRWNFIPWWKTLKKRCKHFILGWNIKISFPKLTCLNIMSEWMSWNIRPLYKKQSAKRKRMKTTSKKSKT